MPTVPWLLFKGEKMKAYVICCNDSVEAVNLKSFEHAERIKKKLSKKHYMEYCQNAGTYEEYQSLWYWHVRVVEVMEG